MPNDNDLQSKEVSFISTARKNLFHYIRTFIVAYLLLIFVALSFAYVKVGHDNFILLSRISGRILLTSEPVIDILKELLAPEIEKALREAYEKEKAKLEAEFEAGKAKLKAELEAGKAKIKAEIEAEKAKLEAELKAEIEESKKKLKRELKQELKSEVDSLIDSDDKKEKLKEAERKLKELFK